MPKLGTDVIENIFDRAVVESDRRLRFEAFEKAVVMYALVLYPSVNAADAYLSFVRSTIFRLPTLVSPNFPLPTMDKIALIADTLMEKRFASCFHPTVSMTLDNMRAEPHLPRASKWAHAAHPPDPPPAPVVVNQSAQVTAPPTPLIDLSTGDLLIPSVEKPIDSSSPVQPSKLLSGYIGFPTRPYRPWSEGQSKPSRASAGSGSPSAQKLPEPLTCLRPPPSMDEISSRFHRQLLDDFGSIERGFKYFDECTGGKSGRVTSTKFFYACDAIGFDAGSREILRSFFRYIDYKSDGFIDPEELLNWIEVQRSRRSKIR